MTHDSQIVRAKENLKFDLNDRVNSGSFGHQVNSDTHLQNGGNPDERLLMSRLIRIFTVCLVDLFFIPKIEV